MIEIIKKAPDEKGLKDEELRAVLEQSIAFWGRPLKRVLLLPPDFTRMHSGGGRITALYYEMLKDACTVDIMPALGTHEPMSPQECRAFFGEGVPLERIMVHDWRNDVVKIGEIPVEYVCRVSEGLVDGPVEVEVNRRLLDRAYDLIISIGQVVPHEVAGMSGYSKNIFVGCGGSGMINQSHMLGAFYGMERIMGRDHSPVRQVFDYAEEHFIKELPLLYVLTVTTRAEERVSMHGIFIGRHRRVFEEAVRLSRQKNVTYVDRSLKKVVVYLDEKEFKSTWLGNKAVYRTRMAIADGGELIVLAPGVRKFGEDDRNDQLIRKYGYVGREQVLRLCRVKGDLVRNLSVAAHLIHGSSDGRFSIAYGVEKLSQAEVEGVNYRYMPLAEALKRYDPGRLKEGVNVLDDGEEVFYIGNPALGLWVDRNRIE